MIVCMGVAGAGKSTLARGLAAALEWRYVEADTFHDKAARQQMAAGRALNDEQRGPWMDRVCQELRWLSGTGASCVLAHSGLRAAHRDMLRDCGFDTRFVHLEGAAELIEQRLAHRPGHFMPPGLLGSQREALQSPAEEQDVVTLDVGQTPEVIRDLALRALARFLTERATA